MEMRRWPAWNRPTAYCTYLTGYLTGCIVHMPRSAPSPPEALKQARLLRGLLQLVKPVEQGAATRPSKLRLGECDTLQAGLSLH